MRRRRYLWTLTHGARAIPGTTARDTRYVTDEADGSFPVIRIGSTPEATRHAWQ